MVGLRISVFLEQVPKNRLLEVIVWDEDPYAPDDRLGMLEISVPEDVEPADKCTIEKIWFLAEVPPDLITGEPPLR